MRSSALVQEPDDVQEEGVLAGVVPFGVGLGLALRLDVSADLGQGDHAEQAGSIADAPRRGEPGDPFAEVPGDLGPTRVGRQVEPGAGQQQAGEDLLAAPGGCPRPAGRRPS